MLLLSSTSRKGVDAWSRASWSSSGGGVDRVDAFVGDLRGTVFFFTVFFFTVFFLTVFFLGAALMIVQITKACHRQQARNWCSRLFAIASLGAVVSWVIVVCGVIMIMSGTDHGLSQHAKQYKCTDSFEPQRRHP